LFSLAAVIGTVFIIDRRHQLSNASIITHPHQIKCGHIPGRHELEIANANPVNSSLTFTSFIIASVALFLHHRKPSRNMSRRTIFTTITPLPAGVSRETVLDTLHDHLEMIDV